MSSNRLTQGRWTNARGDGDRKDVKNYENDIAGNNTIATMARANTTSVRAGILDIANALKYCASLSKIVLRENAICGAVAGKALGDMISPVGSIHSCVIELDLSAQGNWNGDVKLDIPFAQAFACGLQYNTTLATLDMRYNGLGAGGQQALRQAAGSTDLRLSGSEKSIGGTLIMHF
jgi:hypothetical protein